MLEQVVARENAIAALKRVRCNKGSPGIDGMTVDALIRATLVAGGGSQSLQIALPGSYFERLGVPRLAAQTSTY
ncbi:MAG: hypothetical protein ACT443_05345 [Gemmatimonadota bacterium]